MHLANILAEVNLLITLPSLEVDRLVVISWWPVCLSKMSYFGSQFVKRARTIGHAGNNSIQCKLYMLMYLYNTWSDGGRDEQSAERAMQWAESRAMRLTEQRAMQWVNWKENELMMWDVGICMFWCLTEEANLPASRSPCCNGEYI